MADKTADKTAEVNGKDATKEEIDDSLLDTDITDTDGKVVEEDPEIDLTEDGNEEYVLVDDNDDPSETDKDGDVKTDEKTDEAKESEEKDGKKKETDKKGKDEKKTRQDRNDSFASNSRTAQSDSYRKKQYKTDRQKHMKDRSVVVWPFCRGDLANSTLKEHLDKCCHFFIRFCGSDWAKKEDTGHVELRYATREEAKEAVESLTGFKEDVKVTHLTGEDNVEKTVSKMEGIPEKMYIEYRTVYVGSVPTTVTEDTLKATFPDAVTILIPRDDNQVSKGYAYLEYDSVEDATEAAKKYKDVKYEEKELTVRKHLQYDPPDMSGEKLPPGALHDTKRKVIYNKISNTKRRLRQNHDTPDMKLRKIMNGWYQSLVRDMEVRKKHKLPPPTQTPRDPNTEYIQVERKMEVKRQNQYRRQQEEDRNRQQQARMQSHMVKRRRTESGGGRSWRSDADRSWSESSRRRDWSSPAMMQQQSPKPNMNASQTANAVNLLMGLSSMLGSQGGNTGSGGSQGGGGMGGGQGMGQGQGYGASQSMMDSSPGTYSGSYSNEQGDRWSSSYGSTETYGNRDNYGSSGNYGNSSYGGGGYKYSGGSSSAYQDNTRGFANKRRNKRFGKNY